MATRPDVIGVEAATDLSRLKDSIPPFPKAQAMKTIREQFGVDADRLFPRISDPVAAASVAQVHRMETPNGPRAVKILRPGIEKTMELELRAMKRIAYSAQRNGPAEVKRMEPAAFIDTMARSLTREMDLRFEAGAASEFGEIAALDNYVFAPKVDWERTSQRVLVTEWIEGRSLTNPGTLGPEERIDLANRITRGFLACALDHGFFHADLHEGNMILAPDGRLVLVDFGIMGRIAMPSGYSWRRFSRASLSATTSVCRKCISRRAMCRQIIRWMILRRRCVRWASRSSARTRLKFRWRAFCCSCSTSRGSLECICGRS
jgi:ubiquinone biosynthesis protein